MGGMLWPSVNPVPLKASNGCGTVLVSGPPASCPSAASRQTNRASSSHQQSRAATAPSFFFPFCVTTMYHLLLLAGLAGITGAIQPDARPAQPAPLRDLPWAQLNILHTTDVHGWFGGHLQEYVSISVAAPSHNLPLTNISGHPFRQTGETTFPSPTISTRGPTLKASTSSSSTRATASKGTGCTTAQSQRAGTPLTY